MTLQSGPSTFNLVEVTSGKLIKAVILSLICLVQRGNGSSYFPIPMRTKSVRAHSSNLPLAHFSIFSGDPDAEHQSEPFNASVAPAWLQCGFAKCEVAAFYCACVKALICRLLLCICVPRIRRCGRAPPTACTNHKATRSTARSAAGTFTRRVTGEFLKGEKKWRAMRGV